MQLTYELKSNLKPNNENGVNVILTPFTKNKLKNI